MRILHAFGYSQYFLVVQNNLSLSSCRENIRPEKEKVVFVDCSVVTVDFLTG